MTVVTVGSDEPTAKPNGLPMATAHWPICTVSESPSSATGRCLASILTTARSDVGSVPVTWPGNSRPSGRVTVSLSAPATTCSFVRMYPSSLMMTPLPTPRLLNSRSGIWPKKSSKNRLKNSSSGPPPKPNCRSGTRSVCSTAIETTAGPTRRATSMKACCSESAADAGPVPVEVEVSAATAWPAASAAARTIPNTGRILRCAMVITIPRKTPLPSE